MLKQIDMIPYEENGFWVICEEAILGNDRYELIAEHKFATEEEAESFVNTWLKTN
jgi:hypothetical protein